MRGKSSWAGVALGGTGLWPASASVALAERDFPLTDHWFNLKITPRLGPHKPLDTRARARTFTSHPDRSLGRASALVAQRIVHWSPKPVIVVRFHSGAPFVPASAWCVDRCRHQPARPFDTPGQHLDQTRIIRDRRGHRRPQTGASGLRPRANFRHISAVSGVPSRRQKLQGHHHVTHTKGRCGKQGFQKRLIEGKFRPLPPLHRASCHPGHLVAQNPCETRREPIPDGRDRRQWSAMVAEGHPGPLPTLFSHSRPHPVGQNRQQLTRFLVGQHEGLRQKCPRRRMPLRQRRQPFRHVVNQRPAGSKKQRRQQGTPVRLDRKPSIQRWLQELRGFSVQFARWHPGGMKQRNSPHRMPQPHRQARGQRPERTRRIRTERTVIEQETGVRSGHKMVKAASGG